MQNNVNIQRITPEPCGNIVLACGDMHSDELTQHGQRIAYAESDHSGNGFYHTDQLAQLCDVIADCAQNQPTDQLSEFILPARNGTFLLITIGNA